MIETTNINPTTMTKFEINNTYKMNFIGDSNLWVFFTVVKRTDKSVWLTDSNGNFAGAKMFKIKVYNGEETVKPLGNYSMAPVLNAKRKA